MRWGSARLGDSLRPRSRGVRCHRIETEVLATGPFLLFPNKSDGLRCRVMPRHEDTVATLLHHKGQEHFLPKTAIRRGEDRVKVSKEDLPHLSGDLDRRPGARVFDRKHAHAGDRLVLTTAIVTVERIQDTSEDSRLHRP